MTNSNTTTSRRRSESLSSTMRRNMAPIASSTASTFSTLSSSSSMPLSSPTSSNYHHHHHHHRRISSFAFAVVLLVVIAPYFLTFARALDSDDLLTYPVNDAPACPARNPVAGRGCVKACEFESDCKAKRKHCLCDDDCGLSCINPNVKCEKPVAPVDGSVDFSQRKFGAIATFSCAPGFTLQGPETRRCAGGGRWTPMEEPACVRVEKMEIEAPAEDSPNPRYCGHPGKVANARMSGKKFEYPAMVDIVCKEGFKTEAPPGVSSTPKSISKLGKLRCRKDGKWAGVKPVCKPIECVKLPKLRHGVTTGSDTSIGATVNFECNFSYRLIGPTELKCDNDGRWNNGGEIPKCEEIDCKSPGVLYNGWVEGDRTTLESVIIFQCVEGATFEGVADRAKCREDGTWSNPLPKCWQSCIIPELVNGSIHDFLPGSRISHGQAVTFECAQGHVLKNASTAKCDNGSLTQLPLCEPDPDFIAQTTTVSTTTKPATTKPAPKVLTTTESPHAPCTDRPPRIRKGRVVFHNHSHGSKARYECDSGFALNVASDSAELTCQYGKWTGTKPTCEPKYCPFPGYLEDGQIFLVGNLGEYDYRPYIPNVGEKRKIRYNCNKNFKLKGPNAATCVDGEWSPALRPHCIPGKHPELQKDLRGKRSVDTNFKSKFSSCSLPKEVERILTVLQPWNLYSRQSAQIQRASSASSSSSASSHSSSTSSSPSSHSDLSSTSHSSLSSPSSSSSTSLPHGTRVIVSCSTSSSSSAPSLSSTHLHSLEKRRNDAKIRNDAKNGNGDEIEAGSGANDAASSECVDGAWTPTIPECRNHRHHWS